MTTGDKKALLSVSVIAGPTLLSAICVELCFLLFQKPVARSASGHVFFCAYTLAACFSCTFIWQHQKEGVWTKLAALVVFIILSFFITTFLCVYVSFFNGAAF
jgi:hypothetical protein